MDIPEPILRQVPRNNEGDVWWKKTWNYISKPTVFEIMFDWLVTLPDGTKVMVPRGATTDGASIPFFLKPLATSFGPLLRAAILHDYAYKWNHLLDWGGNVIWDKMGQKHADDLFSTVINATTKLSWLAGGAWVALRAFGKIAWNKHRKNEVDS